MAKLEVGMKFDSMVKLCEFIGWEYDCKHSTRLSQKLNNYVLFHRENRNQVIIDKVFDPNIEMVQFRLRRNGYDYNVGDIIDVNNGQVEILEQTYIMMKNGTKRRAYKAKYKVLIVGIARRKIKSIIKMVDIVDNVLDKLGSSESMENMSSSQAIRLLSELNHSMNNDLTFIMKLLNPDTQFRDLQMWVDARSVVNVSGASAATEMKADEILKLSGASRDKIRDAFDALLHQVTKDDVIDIQNIDSEEGEE